MNTSVYFRRWSLCLCLCLILSAAAQNNDTTKTAEDPSAKTEKKRSDGWSGATGKPAAPPQMPVVLVPVQARKLQKSLWFNGSIVSRYQASLAAETPGRLVATTDVGKYFKTDELIAHLDDTLLEKTLLEHQATAESHRAQIYFLQKEVARLSELAKNNNTALSKLEENQAALEMERSALAVSLARAEQTREKIRRMHIVAPFDGVVSRRYADVGEWIKDGDPVVELVNLDDLEVKVSVSAQVLPFLNLGDTLPVVVGQTTRDAELLSIVPVGNDESRLFELRLAADATMGRPQQLVRVAAPIASARNGLAVPEDALVIRHVGISVFVVDAQMIARRVNVVPGISDLDGFIEVAGNLRAGDQVVIRGGERLREGMPVRAVSMSNNS